MTDTYEKINITTAELNNINDIADIKANPVVKVGIMSIVKSVPIIGDLIDSSIDCIL